MSAEELKWPDWDKSEPKKNKFKEKIGKIWDKHGEWIGPILVVIGFIIFFVALIILTTPKEYKIHGPVIERFTTGAGYKVQPQAHIIIHSDSLGRNIDIQVTWNTYANAQIGKVLWFDLTEREMNN